MYEVAISEVEKFERVMNKAVRKWFGVMAHCLSTVALYGKGKTFGVTNGQLGGGV